MYSKLSINILSFIISVVIFNILNFTYENIDVLAKLSLNIKNESKVQNIDTVNETENKLEETDEKEENIQEIEYNWGIYIPKINLIAQISEGTTKEVMDKYVGHFVDTAVVKGNVCLGAHNRGYPVNYFENIKSLEKEDLIYYKKDNIVRKYKVEIVTVIKDTDWTYLENTDDNRVTLITCVENEPDYRRCVQAVEF